MGANARFGTVQEEIGLQLCVVQWIGLERDDLVEHAALVRLERVKSPMGSDVEEHRSLLAVRQLLPRQFEELGEMRPLPFAGKREEPVDGVLTVEQQQQPLAPFDRIASLEDVGIGGDHEPQNSAHDRHARDIDGYVDHSKLCLRTCRCLRAAGAPPLSSLQCPSGSHHHRRPFFDRGLRADHCPISTTRHRYPTNIEICTIPG